MHILIVNDDGIEGEGMIALARMLSQKHKVTVVAPESERSAAAHSYTFQVPLRLKKVNKPEFGDAEVYTTNGTPCDCVILGLEVATQGDVDLILSGINAGANIGVDTLASGTVQAAMEGCIRGVPSMAVSQEITRLIAFGDLSEYFRHAAGVVEKMLDGLDLIQMKEYMLSVNFPYRPKEEVKGLKVCTTGVGNSIFSYKPQTDFVGREHYWINVERRMPEYNLINETDVKWLGEGYITVTPLYPNMTETSRVQSVRDLMESEWK